MVSSFYLTMIDNQLFILNRKKLNNAYKTSIIRIEYGKNDLSF